MKGLLLIKTSNCQHWTSCLYECITQREQHWWTCWAADIIFPPNFCFVDPHYRLSALTFKTFEKMKEYIFIEESVPKQTLIWLSRKQRPNGCFRREDKLVNSAWEVRNPQWGVLSLFPWVICLCCPPPSSGVLPPWECYTFWVCGSHGSPASFPWASALLRECLTRA